MLSSPFQLRTLLLGSIAIFAMLFAACSGDDDNGNGNGTGLPGEDYDGAVIFADYGWDSAIVHNRIAGHILQHGYGYEIDSVPGETIPLFQGLVRGDVNVSMEIWVEQQEGWEPALEEGTLRDHGASFGESVQGWWVPTYMIEGDAERGIDPVAPDLRHVDDLPDHAHLFDDPEAPGMGRFYECIAGWECERVNEVKFMAYGLDETYNRFLPGSGPALAASLVAAYEQGEPWVGYYWAPTWIFGQLDLTMLEEPEYTDECWESITNEIGTDNIVGEQACAYPSVTVNIGTNSEFIDENPEVAEFLDNYETTMDITSEMLLYMQENEAEAEEAAEHFLREYEDLWTTWVPEDVADRVRDSLSETS
jgi:glycine betaine/proline transport system substrate-binding protein